MQGGRAELPDGRVVYPKRGNPPPVPEGYDRDPVDPFTFSPKIPECSLQRKIESLVPCNRSTSGWRTIVQVSCKAGKKAGWMECAECIAFGERDKLLENQHVK